MPPQPRSRDRAAVNVVEALDIVLAEIVPRLNLDDPQDLLGGIFQAMPRADRDIGRLIGTEVEDLLAARDPRPPLWTDRCRAVMELEVCSPGLKPGAQI